MLMVRIMRSIIRRRSRRVWASSLVMGAPPRPKMSLVMSETEDLAHIILFETGYIQQHRVKIMRTLQPRITREARLPTGRGMGAFVRRQPNKGCKS